MAGRYALRHEENVAKSARALVVSSPAAVPRPDRTPGRAAQLASGPALRRETTDAESERRVEIRLHRRRQTVVVRAGDSQEDIELLEGPGRRRMPTLPGLDARERLETIPDGFAEAPPASRTRPVVLLDDVDDERAAEYLAEAERILREGRLISAG